MTGWDVITRSRREMCCKQYRAPRSFHTRKFFLRVVKRSRCIFVVFYLQNSHRLWRLSCSALPSLLLCFSLRTGQRTVSAHMLKRDEQCWVRRSFSSRNASIGSTYNFDEDIATASEMDERSDLGILTSSLSTLERETYKVRIHLEIITLTEKSSETLSYQHRGKSSRSGLTRGSQVETQMLYERALFRERKNSLWASRCLQFPWNASCSTCRGKKICLYQN